MRTVRIEGRAEIVSDFILTCSGGQQGVLITIDSIQVYFNTALTSRLSGGSPTTTESLLLVDDTSTPVLGSTLYQGSISSGNSISFNNVTILSPGSGTRKLRVTNIRVDASGLATTPVSSSPASVLNAAS